MRRIISPKVLSKMGLTSKPQTLLHSAIVLCLAITVYTTINASEAPEIVPGVHRIAPSNDLQYELQNILIQAVPGDVIEFTEGRFPLLRQIDIATDNITLRGHGSDKTIITFKGQRSGGQGIESTGNNFVVEGLAVEDTAGTSGLDLTFTQTDDSKYGFWKSPVATGHGSGGRSYDIVPGEPDKSILLYRIESEDPSIRMPNISRNLVPKAAAKLIREWITSLPPEDN